MAGARHLINRWFCERQVIVRSGGRVRMMVLRPWLQLSATAAALLLVAWAAAGSVAALHFREVAAARGEAMTVSEWTVHELRDATTHVWGRLAQLARETERRRADASVMARREAELRRLLAEQGADLRADANEREAALREELASQAERNAAHVAVLSAKLRAVEDERARFDLLARDLRGRLARVEAMLNEAGERNRSISQQLSQTRGEAHRLSEALARALADRGDVAGRAFAMEQEIARLAGALERQRDIVDERGERLAEAEADRARLRGDRDTLRDQIRDMEKRLVAVSATHQRVIEGIEAKAQTRLGTIERIFALTGISPDGSAGGGIDDLNGRPLPERPPAAKLEASLPAAGEAAKGGANQGDAGKGEETSTDEGGDAARPASVAPGAAGTLTPPPLPARRGGRGGPFIAAPPEDVTPPRYREAVIDLDRSLGKLERYERMVAVMPLGAPLRSYTFESGFGRRVDPFNRRAAMHLGLDFAAPVRSPVKATAPGRIAFAGVQGAYGRMVEIDHGRGLKTRYAHLARIDVREGEVVRRGSVIGLLGSSGRSTGPHVHYEVLHNGRQVNPAKFVEAGRYVRSFR